MQSKRCLFSISLTALAWASAAGAQSHGAEQNAPQVPGIESDEIVVTANKIEQRLQDVPASITAETQQDLQRRGATQLNDIIKTTPGLSNPGGGGSNSSNPTIRNVTTGTNAALTQNTVALLFDDIPVDPSLAVSSTTNLRTVDIERVEVLRGPQGTLFGSGSLSGAIRFITNKPDLSRLGGSVELTGATTHYGNESAWGNLVLNAPIVTGKVAIRGVGYGFSEKGYVDDISTGQKDVNNTKTYGGRLALLVKPSDKFSILASAIYQNSRDEGSFESTYRPVAGRDASDQAITMPLGGVGRLESSIGNVTATYDADFATVTSSTSYMRRELTSRSSANRYNDLLALLLGIPTLAGQPSPVASDGLQKVFIQELRLSSAREDALHWTLGGFYLNDTIRSTQTVTSPALASVIGSGNLADFLTLGKQREIAGFGDVGYRFGDFDVTAGVRVSNTLVRFNSISSGILLSGSPVTTITTLTRRKQTTATPRFTLSYRPTRDLTLYAAASRGYRTGGPNVSAGLGGPGVPTSYDADSLWNYEVGEKAVFLDGRLRVNGSLYLIDWNNIQTSLALNGVSYTGNAGRARIYGGELEAVLKPTPSLELGISVSRSHGELRENVPTLTRVTGVAGVFKGERLPASPEFELGGHAQKTFSVGGRQAFVRVSAQYVGSAYTDFGEPGTRFGDYTTADARIGADVGSVELTVFVENIFDSSGRRSAADATLVGPILFAPQRATRIRPRTLGLTARAAF